jgi:hypothetical protein
MNGLVVHTQTEDLQFANGMFIAVGSAGLIATSTDGVLWTRHYSGSGNDLRGAFYADCHFFAVGNNDAHPTFSMLSDPVLSFGPTRALCAFGWLAGGWYLLGRRPSS